MPREPEARSAQDADVRTWMPHHTCQEQHRTCIFLYPCLWFILCDARVSKSYFHSETNFLFSRMFLCYYWKVEWEFSSLKSVSNRLTRHSRSGKHGRLGHVIGTREMSGRRSLTSIHFISFLMGHGRKFKQMHLCADFNAGQSKE